MDRKVSYGFPRPGEPGNTRYIYQYLGTQRTATVVVNDRTGDVVTIYTSPADVRTMVSMSVEGRGLLRLREPQTEERTWRADRSDWALRTALLDLITSCGLQYFADHALDRDLDLLEEASTRHDDPTQRYTGSAFERRSLVCLRELRRSIPERPRRGDLDGEDEVRRLVIQGPTRVVLGRDDESTSADLVCWNEAHGLVEGMSSPWRCATQLAAVACLSGRDEGALAGVTSLRDRDLQSSHDRSVLDDEVTERARALLQELTTV